MASFNFQPLDANGKPIKTTTQPVSGSSGSAKPKSRFNFTALGYDGKPLDPNAPRAVQQAPTPEAPKKPTFAGELARGLLRTPARILTNVAQAADIATGGEGTNQPFSGDYLGEVKAIGKEGTFGQKLQETVGAGLEMASYLPIAGGAGTLLKGAKPLAQRLIPAAIEGATGGFLGSTGMEMANEARTGEDISLKNIALGTAGGAVLAPALGFIGGKILGRGGARVAEEVAPKIPEVPTTEFTHYSKTPNLKELDPEYFGTGFPSEELRRSQSFADEFPKRTNVYTSQPQVEKNITGLPYKYTGRVEGNLLKSGTEEFDNLLTEAKAKVAELNDGNVGTSGAIITKLEKMAKDTGYVGIEYPEQGTILFNPTKVEKELEQISSILHDNNIKDLVNKSNWGIITATKESLGEASHPLNVMANKQLKEELIDIYGKQNVITVPGKYNGIEQGDSFFVNGATEQELIDLGRKYEQESIANKKGFVYTDGSGYNPMKGNPIIGNDALIQPGYSIINKKPVSFDIDFSKKIPNEIPTGEVKAPTGETKAPIKKTFTEEEFKQKQKTLDEDPQFEGSDNATKVQRFDELKQTKTTDELIDMAVGKTDTPKDLPATAIYKLMKEEKNLSLEQIKRLKNTNVASQAGADLQATQVVRKAFIDNPLDIITLTERELQDKASKAGITKNTIKRFFGEDPCTM